MTFKHVNFSDSVTMRSLERVAREKGWIKEEPIKKEAEAADLSVSLNLTENVIKLCNGLRNSSFHKYADEIEHKFMNYKKAQTIYETSKETGEDLVDAAHPKGSHKLEGVDSLEAVIETIIDKHLAHVKMIEKEPTGKLGSSRDILKAVKTVISHPIKISLARDVKKIQHNLSIVKSLLAYIYDAVAEGHIGGTIGFDKDDLFALIDRALKEANTVAVFGIVSTLRVRVNKLYEMYKPSFWRDLANDRYQKVWSQIGVQFDEVVNLLAETMTLAEEDPEEAPAPPSAFDGLLKQIDSLKEKLTSWLAYKQISTNAQAKKFIQDEIHDLDDIKTRYSQIVESQRVASEPELKSEINSEIANITSFENSWIKRAK